MFNLFRKKSKKNRKELLNNAHVFNRTIVGTSPIDGKYDKYDQDKEYTAGRIINSTQDICPHITAGICGNCQKKSNLQTHIIEK